MKGFISTLALGASLAAFIGAEPALAKDDPAHGKCAGKLTCEAGRKPVVIDSGTQQTVCALNGKTSKSDPAPTCVGNENSKDNAFFGKCSGELQCEAGRKPVVVDSATMKTVCALNGRTSASDPAPICVGNANAKDDPAHGKCASGTSPTCAAGRKPVVVDSQTHAMVCAQNGQTTKSDPPPVCK